MRAPLRAMKGFGDLLLENCSEKLEPFAQDYIRGIQTSALRVDELITDALDYGKILREERPLRPITPMDLLVGIVETYRGSTRPASRSPSTRAFHRCLAMMPH